MVFSSFKFILVFLPLFLISYYFIEDKYKNICLFLFSLGFYAFGCFDNPYYVFILLGSLVFNYVFGIYIAEAKTLRNFSLIVALAFNIGLLFVFKYFDFFLDILHYFNGSVEFNKLNLVLPIGISFYTFQIMSYIIDVYLGKIEAEKDFINLSTYIIMFPQLIAGPILRYSDVKNDIEKNRSVGISNLISGLRVFAIGLASKVIIANQIAGVGIDVNLYGVDKLSFASAWLASAAYGLQLYFDFFGYSLMAIGLGKMIGVKIADNFNDPFLSVTAGEFWRRWHITLGSWFKDYVLYPILMSKPIFYLRKGLNHINKGFSNFIVNLIAMTIVWFLTGLWHGPCVNYILWGLYFLVFMLIEQAFLEKYVIKRCRFFGHIYLIIVAIVSFTIFSNENMTEMIIKLKRMFTIDSNMIDANFIQALTVNIKSIVLAVLFATSLPQRLYVKFIKPRKVIDVIVIILIAALSMYLIYKGFNDPFMYFRF